VNLTKSKDSETHPPKFKIVGINLIAMANETETILYRLLALQIQIQIKFIESLQDYT
jgi:hypothetical protein